MVARTTRRVDPTPAPTGPNPFADAALELYQAGLAVLPLHGSSDSDDDADRKRRRPRVKFRGLKYRFGRATLKGWVDKYPSDRLKAYVLIKQGTMDYDRGKSHYPEAIRKFNELLTKYPKDPLASSAREMLDRVKSLQRASSIVKTGEPTEEKAP